MSTRVVSVLPDAPVSRAVDLMRRYGFSALPVRAMDWEQVVVDDDEQHVRLARPNRAGPPAPDDAPVSSVMTSDVVTVGRTDAISTAVELLLRHRYTALPVVEPDGRLIGLMSEADALGSGRPRGDPLFTQTTHPETV